MALPRALRRRRVPGTMRASSPTEVCSDAWPRPSRLVQNVKFVRRGGIYPARGPCGGVGSPGTMRASSPTGVCSDAWPRPSRLVQNIKFIRRGRIYCAAGAFRRPTAAQRRLLGRRSRPRTLRRRRVPGTMRASSPTGGCGIAGFAFSRLAAGLATIRRGGFHIRPRGVRAAANRADMESAPTGVAFTQGARFPGWPPRFPCPAGRAFTPTAPAGAGR